jgi:branched-chain amino acid transport system substrate-binding protein
MKTIATTTLLAAAFSLAPIASSAQEVVWKTQGVTKDEVVLGIHADLSGAAATFGVPVVNAFRLRIDEVNAAGGINGRKVRLVVEDNAYQVPRAVQVANKLINSDKVFAIVGSTGTPMNAAVLPAQLAAGVPNLFPISWGLPMAEPVHPLKYGIYTSYADQMRGAIKYMVQTGGKKAVCALYQDTDFGREIYQAALAQLKAMKMELVASSTHRPTETDFTVAINKFREAKCDLIAMGTIVRDTLIPYSTARKIGWNDVEFIGVSASYDLAVSGAEGGASEGYRAVGFFDPPSEKTATPQGAAWMKRYRERFNTEPTIQAAIGNTIIDITLSAIQRAGQDLTTRSLVTALEQLRNYQDPFGGPQQSLSPDHHFTSRASVLYKVQDRRWVRVDDVPKP